MQSQWYSDGLGITAIEADELVDLYLRHRLTTDSTTPAPTERARSLQELAYALNAREDELAMMLCQIRDRTKKRPRYRKPIPVRKSWVFIAGIYAGILGLGIACFSFGFNRGARSVGYSYPYYSYPYESGQPAYASEVYNRHELGSETLPMEFGFQFRNKYSAAQSNFTDAPTNWIAAQNALNRVVESISKSAATSWNSNITKEDVEKALREDPGNEVKIERGEQYTPPTYTIERSGRLLNWNRLTVSYRRNRVSILIPTPKTTNDVVEQLVKAEATNRIAKLLKVLQTRVSDDQTALR